MIFVKINLWLDYQLKFNKDKPCDACQKEKQSKSSFKLKNVVFTSRPLEFIHMNLFGPTRVASFSGMHYAYVMVDDYTRYTWVCFLAHKNDAFKAFENFSKKVQKEKSFYSSSIRSDHWTKFENEFFKTFCNENTFHIRFLLLELLKKWGYWKEK